MTNAATLVEVWRGDFLESLHTGHAVVCNGTGDIVEAWGDPSAVILPRSACKMIQALPLIESGAAKAYSLTSEQLALSCASHNAAAIHTDRVQDWLNTLGLADDDLRCGAQWPNDKPANASLIRAKSGPCQYHNNCSGKHTGFLTLNAYLRGGTEYIEADHPVQVAVRGAFEDVTNEPSPGYAIDGCSAPNFATSVHGLAKAMAQFATHRAGTRGHAMATLVDAMTKHPELVAGEERCCTELMRQMDGVAIKTGAEGVFTGILPKQGLGIAVKITDGATRAADCMMASLLIRLGALDANDPAALRRRNAPILNRRKIDAAYIRPVAGL